MIYKAYYDMHYLHCVINSITIDVHMKKYRTVIN